MTSQKHFFSTYSPSSIKDAIQTSLLSHKFRYLWHSMPSLNFDGVEYYARSTSPNPRTNVSRQLFAEFIYHTLLARRPYPLTKFALTFEYILFDPSRTPRYKYFVQNWIRYAIGLKVTQLVLQFNYYDFDDWTFEEEDEEPEWYTSEFELCLLDVSESCVEVLKLFNCSLIVPEKSNPVKFVYLKSVEICSAHVRDEDVCALVGGCVNLETLKLKFVEFIRKGGLDICSASLKELCIEYASHTWLRGIPSHLNICCPSLQKISLIDSRYEKYTIKDATMLVEACLDFSDQLKTDNKSWEKLLSCFTNVSSLCVWEELLETNGVPDGCERFSSNVKHLELYCAYEKNDLVGLAALLKLLPNLEVLVLHNRLPFYRVTITKDIGAEDIKLHKDDWGASTVFKIDALSQKSRTKSVQENNWRATFH